jgi:hypothetical protein
VRLADKYGVSEKTIRRDGRFAQVIDQIVADYGDPEIQRKLLGADARLTHPTARLLLRMPPDERKAAVDHLVEFGELARASKERPAPAHPREVAQSLLARLRKKGEVYAHSVVQQMARLLGLEVMEKACVG